PILGEAEDRLVVPERVVGIEADRGDAHGRLHTAQRPACAIRRRPPPPLRAPPVNRLYGKGLEAFARPTAASWNGCDSESGYGVRRPAGLDREVAGGAGARRGSGPGPAR